MAQVTEQVKMDTLHVDHVTIQSELRYVTGGKSAETGGFTHLSGLSVRSACGIGLGLSSGASDTLHLVYVSNI